MALIVRVKPRAERQIVAAALWWSENRPAAPGAIRSDLQAALEVLVEQPGIGTLVEIARDPKPGACISQEHGTSFTTARAASTLKSSRTGIPAASTGQLSDAK